MKKTFVISHFIYKNCHFLVVVENILFFIKDESTYFKVLVHFRILKKSIFFCIFQLLRPLKIFS